MWNIYDRIWHYLSSNSRHGTHSPFIYRLADEVIYKVPTKQLRGEKGSDCLMQEISEYYSSNIVHSVDAVAKDRILVIDIALIKRDDVVVLQEQCAMIFLNNIYKNKLTKKKWSAIGADQRISVTIDLFYFGIVILRKEQPKENFKLRFPYWKY